MNSVIQLLAELAAKDIRLWLEEGKLRFSAPEGALTPAIRDRIVAQKTQIIEFIEQAGKQQQISIPRSNRNARLAASFAQQRLWFLNQLDPDSPAYNMAGALHLAGTLDVNALNGALSEIVVRHEILRTRYADDDDGLNLIIDPATPITVAVQTLPATWHGDASDIINTLAQAEATKPFNLTRDKVMRITLYRIADNDHLLLTTLHHIASDGWSMGVLVAELAALYTAFHSNQASPLPALSLQYTDYAAWQHQWLAGERLEKQLQFWRDTLADTQVLLLPTDKPRPPMATSHGDAIIFEIDAATTGALNTLARNEGATLFMVLMSAFRLLLERYSRQSDITIGTPVAGRTLGQLEALIGCFINTVAIRCDNTGCVSFNDALTREKSAAQAAFDHQDVPFEQIVDSLSLARDMAYTPLFQVMFALQNAPANYNTTLPGLDISAIDLDKRAAMFDLKLSMNEVDGRIVSEFEYRTDLFERASIERLANHFSNWLGAIVKAPAAPLATLNFITADEQQFLLGNCNIDVTTQHPPQLVHHRFEQVVEQFADRAAVSYDDARASYAELNTRANRIAHALIAMGVRAGDFVGLALERSCDLLAGIVGIAKAGAAYVPLDPHFPADRLAYIYDDAQAKALVSTQAIVAQLNLPADQALLLDRDAATLQHQPHHNPNVTQDAGSVLYVLYTSGTTGKPKGCLVTHANVSRLMSATDTDFGFDENDRWTLFHSYAFDFTVWEMWGALLYGGELVVVPYYTARDSEAFHALLRDQRITVLNQTPSAFSQLIAVDAMQPANAAPLSLRYVVFGGEALDFPALRTWAQRHGLAQPTLVNMYGITETTVHVTRHTVTQSDLEKPRSIIGRPITDLHLHIVSPEIALLPVGVPGEIVVSGAGVTNGYLHRADLTAEKFVSNPFAPVLPAALQKSHQRLYRSGDLARRLPNGDIEYLGRIDQQVKIRGHRIELGEIEAALGQQPGIREAVVLARQSAVNTGGKADVRLAGYLLVATDSQIDLVALRENLKAFLPEYMIPAAFVTLTQWPLTPTGKVDKKALPEPDVTTQAREFIAPRSALEQQIAAIFSDVLNVERVGINDSFFELGGHSLLATQVVSRLRKLTNRELPLRAMFIDPTVAGIAQALDAQQLDAAPPLVAINPRPAHIPLSFSQQRLWLVDQLIPGNAAYHMPAALTLRGVLDHAALQRAIGEVIARHEILRTVFVRDNEGNPWQRIEAFDGFILEIRDLRTLDAATRNNEVLEQAKDVAWQAFDLAAGPLLRTRLLVTSSDAHVLLLNMHHIISDGWSLGVLVQEIAASYHANRNGITAALPPLSLQYADFAIWQRQWLSGDVLQHQLDFWKQALRNAPTLELPLDFPRPRTINTAAGEVDFTIAAATANALQQLAQQHSATLFMALEAVLATLLARHSGQDDICVGSTIANRNRIETEPLIGFFVNTLVIRNDFSARPDFNTLLAQVRDFTLAAYDHQDIPFEQIVEHVGVQRQLDRTPLFQVLLSLQNNPLPSRIEQPGLAIEQLDTGAHPAKFDLSVHIAQQDEALAVTLRYRSDLFTTQRMQTFAAQFQRLLDLIIDNPNAVLDSLPLIDAQQQQTLASWNNNAKAFANRELTVDRIIATAATAHPQRIAVVAAGEALKYGELEQRANQLAHYLRANGAKPDNVIAILMERCTDAIVAMLGILKAGAAYTFIDHEYPPERIAHIVNIAQPLIVLTDTALRSHLGTGVNSLVREDFAVLLGTQPDTDPGTVITPDNLAYVVFTSGSTGLPKGVAIEHRNLTNYIAAVRERLQLPAHASHASVSTLAADLGNTVLYHALADAGTLHLIDKQTALSGAQFAAYNNEHRIDCLKIVPSHLRALLDCADPAAILPQRCLVLGGEALHRDLVQNLRTLKPACCIVNHYGPSETTVGVACTVLDDDHASRAVMPIGRAFANVSFHIVNRELQPQPIGIPGELLIGGAQVGRGYLNRDDLSAERFIENPFGTGRLYRSGDLARFLDNGEVQILGRIDRQVKLRGFRIELAEIEAAIAQLPQVGNAAVKLVSRNGNDLLVAYLAGEALTLPQLRAALRDKLPDYMVPSVVVMLEALPLNANGKVDYHALPAPSAEHFNDREYIAPRNDTERYLAGLWQDILGLERIGIDDNFFEIGGHSLAATRVIARAQQQYTVELDLRSMFEQPTIAVIATAIDAALLERALIIDSNSDVTSDDDEEMVL